MTLPHHHRLIIFSLLAVLLLATAGCILSLQPFYTPDDIVTRSELPGRWTSEDGRSIWTFEPSDDGDHYALTIRDEDGQKGKFITTLTHLGEELYIDFYPQEPGEESTLDFYNIHLIPAHTFYRVYLDDELFTLDYIKEEWLEDYLKKNPDALSHTRAESQLVITASTKELREFVATRLDANASFENFAKLKKAD